MKKLGIYFLNELQLKFPARFPRRLYPSVSISLKEAQISYSRSPSRKAVVKVLGKLMKGKFYEYHQVIDEINIDIRGFLYDFSRKTKKKFRS